MDLDEELELKAMKALLDNDEYLQTFADVLRIKEELKTNLKLHQLHCLWNMYSDSLCATWMEVNKREIERFVEWLRSLS